MPLPLNIAARRSLTAAALGLALSGASLLASAPAANAAFTLAPCTGTDITGAGSTFQTAAHNYWNSSNVFRSTNSPGCGGAPGGPPAVGYTGGGSGKGLTSFGANGGPRPQPNSNRFVGTDDPPSPTQQANINGGSANGTDSGTVHVLPVAGGAATVIVHFPEGCTLKDPGTGSTSANDNASTGGPNDLSGPTGDSAANNTLRVHISNATLEKIFEHAPSGLTWGDVVPAAADLTGMPTNTLNAGAGSCAAVPIRRIVRQDTSGTTFTFKNYLSLVAPAFGWTGPTYANPNTVWPQVNGGNSTPPPPDGFAGNSNTCNQTQAEGYICTGAAPGGGGSLANAVNATDGSIGYVDLATARSKGFVVSPTSTPNSTTNHQYWVPLQAITGNGSTTNGPYQEPTFNPGAHQNGSNASGANCANANYRGIPSAASSPNGDPSEGDWSNAIATGSSSSGGGAYPVCVLTYELAFDDNATVFHGAGEEGKARTVKDYLVNITSNAGQALTGTDYATLPLSLTTIAQNGVKAIDWNKAANQTGGGGTTTTNPNPGGGGSQGGGATTAGGGPSAPSNEFSLLPVRVSGGRIVVGLSLPGPGQVHIAVSARYRGQSFSVRDLVADVGGGQGSVSLTPSARTLSVLKKAKRLGVSVTVTYTPSGGSASTKSETGTLVQGKSAKHKKHKKHKKHHKAKHPKHAKKK